MRAGVYVQTVRYYERRGLLRDPRRRSAGYREYTDATLDRLRFIKRAQELGFTLSEIGKLLTLRVNPGTTAADVKQRVKKKTHPGAIVRVAVRLLAIKTTRTTAP